MADSRIDELRKRLEKEPGSRLFAQLAEELRKNGELAEAIRVCKDGLQKQPAYHSARMTLARALLDSGVHAAARPEFEAVLKAAPDNILASRLLAECLESLGDLAAARARYKTTLALAPTDKHLQARLEAVEARLSTPAAPTPAQVAPTSPPPAPAPAPEPEPVGVVEEEPKPIPLVAAEESFELEAAYEAPTTRVGFEAPAPPAAAASPPPPPVPALSAGPAPPFAPAPTPAAFVPEPEQEFVDFEEQLPEPLPAMELVSRPLVIETSPAAVPVSVPAPPVVASAFPEPVAELASATLGELYFSQGHTEKAIETYRQVVEREPGNERAKARLTELVAIERHFSGAPEPTSPVGGRRGALLRTIQRLEGMLAATRRGVSA